MIYSYIAYNFFIKMTDIFFNLLGDLTNFIENYNYGIIFFLMAIESSFIPFPSEIIMIPSDYLVAKGKLSFTLCLLSGILGSIVGALVNYYIAKTLGFKLLKRYGKYFFLSQKNLTKIQRFFQDHGSVSTFTGRLLPAIRQYISFPAGLAQMNLNKFIFFTALGSGLWVLVLILLGIFFGHNEQLIKENLKIITLAVLFFVTIIIMTYIIWHKVKKNKCGNDK